MKHSALFKKSDICLWGGASAGSIDTISGECISHTPLAAPELDGAWQTHVNSQACPYTVAPPRENTAMYVAISLTGQGYISEAPL